MNIEDRLALLARNVTPDEAAADVMRLALFDWAVCAIAGRHEPVAKILRQLAMDEQTSGPAIIVGGGMASAARAALINGATSHALDYDDTHFGHIGHTSVAVMPAILSLSAGRNMQEVIAAALIGSEAAIRVGLWLGRDHYQTGFHQTATAGAFGAAVGVAHLLELHDCEVRHALGLASTKAAGLKSQFGTMGKPLNAGLAAEAGVLSAQWAQAGMTSSGAGLSGPQGFGETHHAEADTTAFDGLGHRWHVMDISHKFHACCHGLHAMLEALSDVSLPVSQVAVQTHPRWLTVCNIADPHTGLECKFSYKMTAAMHLSGLDTARIESYSDEAASDPALHDLCQKVSVSSDPGLSEMQCRVIVTDNAGNAATYFHDLNAPMAYDARAQRLKQKARAVIGRAQSEELWDAVQADDPKALLGLLNQA